MKDTEIARVLTFATVQTFSASADPLYTARAKHCDTLGRCDTNFESSPHAPRVTYPTRDPLLQVLGIRSVRKPRKQNVLRPWKSPLSEPHKISSARS